MRSGRYNRLPTNVSCMCWGDPFLSVLPDLSPSPGRHSSSRPLSGSQCWNASAAAGGASSSHSAVAPLAFSPLLCAGSSCIEKWLMNCAGSLLVCGLFPSTVPAGSKFYPVMGLFFCCHGRASPQWSLSSHPPGTGGSFNLVLFSKGKWTGMHKNGI